MVHSERQKNLIPERHPRYSFIKSVEVALRESWSEQTCYGPQSSEWSSSNPALGQCAVSTLVLIEIMGTGIVVEDKSNLHFWYMDDFGEVDLTREQFGVEVLIKPTGVISRESLLDGDGADIARTKQRFELLLGQVLQSLRV